MNMHFQDRRDAGRFLAKKLEHHAEKPDVIVLALPRGGVPVAFEIAKHLNAPLDVFIVRKLGAPIFEELAMGAIASGGTCVLNETVIRNLGISQEMIHAKIAEERRELERRERNYRGGRSSVEVQGNTVILVDDGLATGASMRAAVLALKKRNPKSIVVAVPVGAPETCAVFEKEVDEVLCGIQPEDFGAVGSWYVDFTQTTDEEVCEFLDAIDRQVQAREHIGK
jgi:putative phosphoribosyl transferase